jgi:hypothetical protein
MKLKPKLPPGVFVMFKSEELQINKELYKHMDLASKTELVKQKWKVLPVSLKATFNERRQKELLIYKQKMAVYQEALKNGTLLAGPKKHAHQPFIKFCKVHFKDVRARLLRENRFQGQPNKSSDVQDTLLSQTMKKLSRMYHEEKRVGARKIHFQEMS